MPHFYAKIYKYVQLHNSIYAKSIQVLDLSYQVPTDDNGEDFELVSLDLKRNFSIPKECF